MQCTLAKYGLQIVLVSVPIQAGSLEKLCHLSGLVAVQSVFCVG